MENSPVRGQPVRGLFWALIAVALASAQPPTAPAIVSFAVESSGTDEIVWPQLDAASAFTVQSCPDLACSSPTDVPGTPAALCVSCQQFVLAYTPPGRRGISSGTASGLFCRRLSGVGDLYRVRWTATSDGVVSYSRATAAQEGTGPGSPTCTASSSSPLPCTPLQKSKDRPCSAHICRPESRQLSPELWQLDCSLQSNSGCDQCLPQWRNRLAGRGQASALLPQPGFSGGSYSGAGNRGISFLGKAIAVSSSLGAPYTALALAAADRAFIFNTNEIFTSVLNGVTILEGSAGPGGSGAGILVDSAGPVISNCIFSGGRAQGDGGALVITNSKGVNVLDPTQAYKATVQISGTTFINNTAQNGGAIALAQSGLIVSNSLFTFNFATQPGAGRGGAIVANFAGFKLTDVVISNCFAVFSGGALHTEAAITIGVCSGVQMFGNAATSFGGAFTSFAGSNLFFTQSEFSDNVSGFYGGGILALYGNATVTKSKINRNRSTYGGGATKALAGSMFLDECQVANNTANAGAGTEIAGAAGYVTVVGISNTVISGNSAALQGAGFNLGSTNSTTFVNVTFSNNVATTGGAGYCAGDINPLSGSLNVYNSTFVGNDAQLGGSLYATTGCIANIAGTRFSRNTARQYGSAIVTTDYVTLGIQNSTFVSNGDALGQGILPPMGGGAISIGYNQFVVGGGVSLPTNVSIQASTFTANIATDRGGAVNLQSGSLALNASLFSGNQVTAASITDVGTGGAIAIIDACSAGACSPAVATITATDFTGNYAFQAGGGIYFSGANPGSLLNYTQGALTANRVQYTLGERNKAGLGGAIFLGNSSFTLRRLALSNNSAYFGGAVFASANFSRGGVLEQLDFGVNNGLMGTDQFWVRGSSPGTPLSCQGCSQTNPSALRNSTEVVQLNYSTAPPASVQSNQAADTFVVVLQDYYGNQGLAEFAGTCQAVYNGSTITLPELGRVVNIYNGSSTFQQLVVQGGIGSSFNLQVVCTLDTTGQNALLPRGAAIPPIQLQLRVELCPKGTEEQGILCQPCDLNFYNYNDTTCQPCPEGAQCPGGSLGLQNPILTQAGYWRSSNTSSEVYRCASAGACGGYPTLSGEAYGNAACPPGSIGPLCAVCAPGSFGFGGQCKTCTNSPQGNLMLAFAVLLFVALIVVLFVFDFGTDIRPGVMTKIKTLLTHFQLLSLFRTYDLTWPESTEENLGWADVLNVGVSVAAPGCWISGYNFYVFYIMQMSLPIVLVLMCFAILAAAVRANIRIGEYIDEGAFTKRVPESRAEYWREWLAKLQTRCYKNSFWFVTLLYPRCAQTSMQMFATQTLDVGTFLKADYSISTKSPDGKFYHTYAAYLVFGTILVILFTIVLPVFYFLVIFRLRFRLQEEAVIRRYGFLYGGYAIPYWEVADMIRKLAIAAIPVFIRPQPTGSLQAVLGEIVIVTYIFVIAYLRPFANANDNLLQVGSMLVLFLLLLSGESLKWAKLSPRQQGYVSDGQIVLTTGVALCVILYAIFSLGFVRRRLKAVYQKLGGKANKVAPEEAEEAASSSSSEAEPPLDEKREKGFWSDSEFSSRSGETRDSSPREGGRETLNDDSTANPLLAAFPHTADGLQLSDRQPDAGSSQTRSEVRRRGVKD